MAVTKTSWKKGKPGGPGRPRLSEAEKRRRALQRAAEFDYKMECRLQLMQASDLVGKRLASMNDGNLLRAKEILRDTVHGRPAQVISGPDGGPLVGTFVAMLGQVDGAKVEKLVGPAVEKANAHANGNGNGSGNVATHEKL